MANPHNEKELKQKISIDISVELKSHAMDNFTVSALYGRPWRSLSISL
ncbi:MAG: hypothetical protein SPI72_04525 [Porphyromonas sp.]|nr:hypothetical protein [Porphyromonas sp.]